MSEQSEYLIIVDLEVNTADSLEAIFEGLLQISDSQDLTLSLLSDQVPCSWLKVLSLHVFSFE